MKIPSEHILGAFVDRVDALNGFTSILGDENKRIMWIAGPSGIGKSVLLSRMMFECRQREVPWLHVEWHSSHRYGYLDLMRRLRDVADRPEVFNLFNDRVNYFTKPGYEVTIKLDAGDISNVRILEGGVIESSGTQIHVGHTVEIRDLTIPVQRPDFNLDDRTFQLELTNAFFPCFQALTRERPHVLFLDALEKADQSTLSWLWDELFTRVSEREIVNVFVVLAGQQAVEVPPRLFDCMRTYQLQPFRTPDIEEYLRRRGIAENEVSTLARFLTPTAKTPYEIANQTNAYLVFTREQNG